MSETIEAKKRELDTLIVEAETQAIEKMRSELNGLHNEYNMCMRNAESIRRTISSKSEELYKYCECSKNGHTFETDWNTGSYSESRTKFCTKCGYRC